jgi:hypothetical protein
MLSVQSATLLRLCEWAKATKRGHNEARKSLWGGIVCFLQEKVEVEVSV